MTLATHLAGKLQTKVGSALRRIYPLLSNPRIRSGGAQHARTTAASHVHVILM